jgi:hypothetical protein
MKQGGITWHYILEKYGQPQWLALSIILFILTRSRSFSLILTVLFHTVSCKCHPVLLSLYLVLSSHIRNQRISISRILVPNRRNGK